MAGLIPAGVLADLQGIVNRSMPDTALIARTGKTVPCRVQSDTQYLSFRSLPGLPHFIRLPRWGIYCPVGTDLNISDTVTVNGAVYTVVQTEEPRSYETAVLAFTVMQSSPATPFPVYTNATMSFYRPSTRQTIAAASVVVERIREQDTIEHWAIGFDYYLGWYSKLAYADGTSIQAGDTIQWPDLINDYATLKNPVQVYGSVPLSYAVFRENE